MVLLAAQICEEKKGTDTRILELDPVDAGFSDFFLITSGNNTRQTGAIADEIELRMKREFGVYAKAVEGRRQGEWILLDYLDFVVHIFTEQTREFYDIERLRKSARTLGPAELSATLREKTEAARKKAPAKKALPPGTPATLALTGKAEPSAKKSAKKAAKKALAKLPSPTKSPAKHSPEPPAKKSATKKAPAKSAAKKAAKKAAEKSPAKKAAKNSSTLAKSAQKASRQAAAEDTSRPALPSGTPARKQLPAPSTES